VLSAGRLRDNTTMRVGSTVLRIVLDPGSKTPLGGPHAEQEEPRSWQYFIEIATVWRTDVLGRDLQLQLRRTSQP
jgi:hypothetical protein